MRQDGFTLTPALSRERERVEGAPLPVILSAEAFSRGRTHRREGIWGGGQRPSVAAPWREPILSHHRCVTSCIRLPV